ncbi:hypothetical protein SKAU_G00347040 [Synaphobranchus kaupii]|uniref:Uncharacterized protein n=1 Tax=Synaphobranchus kaupii TaxID=118154 RepID=A0A9Q1EJR4_SYNKA|nr:hypothetical protein SKAU_G00347040 [Synaphobranchus kaupii]
MRISKDRRRFEQQCKWRGHFRQPEGEEPEIKCIEGSQTGWHPECCFFIPETAVVSVTTRAANEKRGWRTSCSQGCEQKCQSDAARAHTQALSTSTTFHSAWLLTAFTRSCARRTTARSSAENTLLLQCCSLLRIGLAGFGFDSRSHGAPPLLEEPPGKGRQ